MTPARERWVWLTLLAVVVVGFLWFLTQVRSLSVPLLIAFFIAYVLLPLADGMHGRGMPRTLAALLLVIGFFAVLVTGLSAVPRLVARDLALLPERIGEIYVGAATWLEEELGREIPTTVDEIVEQLLALDPARVTPLLQLLFGRTVGVLGAMAGLALVPVLAFFLLRDYHRLIERLRRLVPPRHREAVASTATEIDRALGGFLRGQLIVASIMAVLFTVGFYLVGLRLPVVVGLIAGLLNFIPYLGFAVGFALATLMVLLYWVGWPQLLAVWAVFLAVQSLESWFLTPKIVGHATGVSAFGVVVAVLFFGTFFGFLGLLLAVPLAALLQIGVRIGLGYYRRSDLFARGQEAEEPATPLDTTGKGAGADRA